MHKLADLFSYLYFEDLPTLDLIILEANRIRAERRGKGEPTLQRPAIPEKSIERAADEIR
jgi:hypothetical protein